MRNTLGAVCAATFVFILGLSAYWDPSIRVVHVFEAVPYALAAVLVVRRNMWGYMLGIASGTFWLWMAGTRTRFVRSGFERLWMLLTTGSVDRWDVLIAAPAALATAGVALFAFLSYCEAPLKSRRDVLGFAMVFTAVTAYFLIIFWFFAPQYLRLFPLLS